MNIRSSAARVSAVRRIGGQDLAVDLDRLGHVDQRQLVDLREPELQRDAILVGSARSGSRCGRPRPARPTAGRARTGDRARPAPACCPARPRRRAGRSRSPRRAGRSPPRRRARAAAAARLARRVRRPSRSRARSSAPASAQCPVSAASRSRCAEHVLVVRIVAQRAPVDVERRVLVRQPALLDLGDAGQQLDGLAPRRRCAPPSPRRPRSRDPTRPRSRRSARARPPPAPARPCRPSALRARAASARGPDRSPAPAR